MADVTGDDRGLSTVVGYVLGLAITVLVLGGLVAAASGAVADQRERTVRDELEVVGQHIASDIMTVDRLARASDGGTARVSAELPHSASGAAYTVRIDVTNTTGEVVLTAPEVGVTVSVSFTHATPVTSTAFSGGSVVVRYDGSSIRVVADE